jgi:hypothetical protein
MHSRRNEHNQGLGLKTCSFKVQGVVTMHTYKISKEKLQDKIPHLTMFVQTIKMDHNEK